MKNLFNFKWLLLSFILSIASINQAWAGYEKLNSGNMKYTFNGGDEETYNYKSDDHDHVDVNLGTLTSSFIIKSVSFQFSDDWATHGSNVPFLYMVYSYDNWDNRDNWNAGTYNYDWSKYWVYKNPWNYTIATYEGNSGNYTLKYYWELNWQNGTKSEINNNSATYVFKYTIDPPAVKNFSVSEANHVHGDGSEGNPYILPYGSDLSLTINGEKHHDDDNSSVQYYNTSSADAWSTTRTKTIPSVTSSTATSVTVIMRYKHNTLDLTGTESSETIWYKADANYTVSVGVADGSTGLGTVSTSSVNVGVYASQPITATANSHYIFDGWECTGGASVADASNRETTVTATADGGSVKAKFASVWAIKGGDSDDVDSDDAMGNWGVFHGLTYTGTPYIYEGTIPLPANTTYKFKVYDRPNNFQFGYGNDSNNPPSSLITFIGQSGEQKTYSGNQHNLVLMSAGAGTYTFTWNSNTKELTVSYPIVTHPSSDYVYFKDDNGWDTDTYDILVHVWGGSTSSTGWDNLPHASTFNFDGTTYYYTALGDNNTALFAGSEDKSTKQTENLTSLGSASTKRGKYYDVSSDDEEATRWQPFTATLTLDKTIGTNTPSPSSITVTYGSNANLTGDVIETAPTNDNYSFAGFYTQEGGAGVKFIDASTQNVMASVPGILDAGKNWIKTGESVSMTIYAAWTQNITLDQNEATKSGSTSLAATYKATLSTGGLTEPKKIGYAFAGWTATKDGTDVVIAADGTVNEVSGWTDSDKKWIHSTSSKLYAKWTEDVNEFTGTDGVWDKATNWSAGKVPTNDYSSVTISKPVTITEASVHIGELAIGTNGSLTITSTGALEVEGTITNTDVEKIVVKPSGALIFNSTGSTRATIELALTANRWQMFAIPVGYVDVKDAFVGSNVFTFVWNNTNKVWDRRGYYDGLSAFEPVLIQGSGGYNFKGALVSTTVDQGGSATYDGEKNNGNVSMFGNSWTAPIAVSGITFTNIDASTPHVFDGSTWDGVLYNEIIPALQGFAVVAKSGGGSVTIPYSAVRAVESENRNESLKAPKHRTSETSDPIAIYISGNEWKNRIRLFESEQFSDEIDDGYEAVYIEGEGYAGELYAQKTEKKMNVLATNDLEGSVVGFFPGEATNYTISFEGDGKGYYLNDVKKEEATLIAEGNTYMFTPDEGSNSARFVISKTPIAKTPTSVENLNDGVKARKQLIDGVLYIVRDGKLYNSTGTLVK